jgi:hypothetical protein
VGAASNATSPCSFLWLVPPCARDFASAVSAQFLPIEAKPVVAAVTAPNLKTEEYDGSHGHFATSLIR